MLVSRTQRRRAARQAGFTMVEMLAVIAFIGIVVAAAAPTWVELQRDRRVDNAATQIADIFRVARARALGRGSATVVRYDANAAEPTVAQPAGRFTMREAVAGSGGASKNLPSASCFTPDWSDAGDTSKYVMAFDDRRKSFEPATVSLLDPDGATQNFAQICFTPRGRSYVRYSSAGTFTVMTGVPRVQVTNQRTKLNRFVVFPPHGSARVVSDL